MVGCYYLILYLVYNVGKKGKKQHLARKLNLFARILPLIQHTIAVKS